MRSGRHADGNLQELGSGVIRAPHEWGTNEVEAGGNAVRRTALLGLLVFSVLGFSGCANSSRRLDWSSPWAASADASETPAPRRFTWWRVPRADSATTDAASDDLAQAIRAAAAAADTKVPGDVWPEPKLDWAVRYFPHLSRLWNGNATGNAPAPEQVSDAVRVSSRSWPPSASGARRADDDVHPVDASANDDIASRDGSALAEKPERFVPPIVPTPLLVRSGPESVPERTTDVELDVSKVDPGRKAQTRSHELETPQNSPDRASSSVAATPAQAIAPGDDVPADAPAETSAGAEPTDSRPGLIANPEPETVLVQAPAPSAPNTQPPSATPPPPPLNRIPPPPPPLTDEKPAAKPDQPEAPPAPKVADEAKPNQPQETNPQPAPVSPAAEVPPNSASPAPPVPPSAVAAPSVPPSALAAPVSTQRTPAQSLATGRRPVYASDQATYASPPPMAPPRPRPKFLSLFYGEEKKEPLASPQLPPATFPTTYYGTYPRPYPVLAATQANDITPPVTTKTTKKPCVLTAWFQRITSGGHGCCCTGCHHARPTPCCSGCTCNGENNKSGRAAPQTSLASPQSELPARKVSLSERVSTGSTGPKPGDVAEEGKLFERVSFESFDKAPKS